jgi:hemerythrin-like metal-binding protein
MPLIELTEEMSVGVEEIDAEHQKLADAVNQLYDGLQSGAGREQLAELFDKLIILAVSHFVHEERLFAKTSYPDRDAHTAEHADMKRWIVDAHDRFLAGSSDALTDDFARKLKGWLVDHIMQMDRKYGGHLNAHGIQ